MKKNTDTIFTVIACLSVASLLISNTTSLKLIKVGPFVFTGGVLIFPVTYILGDLITEIWGYSKNRLIIYLGLFCSVLMTLSVHLDLLFAPAEGWNKQREFETIFSITPRIVIASLVACFFGEFVNGYVIAKMKLVFKGKQMGLRFITSTLLGESVDTLVFVSIALYGSIPDQVLFTTIWSGILFKSLYEIIALPVTIPLVKWLKRKTGQDVYDDNTDFNPAHLLT